MKRKKTTQLLKQYLCIMLGTVLLGVSISVFYEPNNIVTGGFTGLGIILSALSEQFFPFAVPVWLTNLICNAPLFLIGAKIFKKEILFKTLFATLFLSFALIFTSRLPKLSEDLLLATVFGALFSGLGLGLVFRCKATTGGTDLLASLMQRKRRHLSVAKIMFFLDACVILMGFFIFGPLFAMYSVISVFVSSKIIDNFLDGLSFAKMALIVSERAEQIAALVVNEMGRGVTCLQGVGMYTGQSRCVLMCVVSKKELVLLKEIVLRADKDSFVLVSDVKEALGEGFAAMQPTDSV